MKRFRGPLSKLADRLFSGRARDSESGDVRPAAAKPLAMTFRAAEDAAAATEQLFNHVRKIEDCLNDIRDDVAVAWQDQSRATQEYYDLARGIMLALDDLKELAASQPGLADIVARLENLLGGQDMAAIPVAAGDAFSADAHVCNRTEPSAEILPGRVLAVVSPGYRRRLLSGDTVVVRPAQVVVSQSPVESETPKP